MNGEELNGWIRKSCEEQDKPYSLEETSVIGSVTTISKSS